MIPTELLLPIISAILSVGAFIVATITLWISHLKGPDIDLWNIPAFKIQEERFHDRPPNYIPNRLDFEPIQFVFANNGSRAGVITEIIPSFIPSAEFHPFYNGIYFGATRRWPERGKDSYSDLPVSVREGENCVVELNLALRLPEWREHIRSEELRELSNVKKVVEQSLNSDKQDFINFLDFVRSRKPFGTLTFELLATSKKSFKTQLEKKKIVGPMEIENTLEELEDYLVRCLENWDGYAARGQLLAGIPSFLDRFIEPLVRNLQSLKKSITASNFYGLRDLGSEMRDFRRQGSEVAKLIMKRENLEKVFEEISNRARDFNYEMQIVRSTIPDVEEKDFDHLNTIRKELEQSHEKTLKNLRRLKKKLRKELT